MVGVDVGSQSASGVKVGRLAPYYLSRACVAQVGTVGERLVYHEVFESWTGRIEVGQMLCIAMSETCGVKQRAVVVDSSRAVSYLVASVVIDISHGNAVCPLSVGSSLEVFCLVHYLTSAVSEGPVAGGERGVEPSC